MTNNIDQIKKTSCISYMESIGFHPVKETNTTATYVAVWRNDTNASLTIDKRKNVWYDHGAGKGGSIIDLVMTVEGCTFSDACKKLESGSFSFVAPVATPFKQKGLTIERVQEIGSRELHIYLVDGRGIRYNRVKKYIKEVHYSVNGKNKYYAIGFPNDKGGFELRNSLCKGGNSPKYISTIQHDFEELWVFEGFMDFLSVIDLFGKPAGVSVIVLNSLSNIKYIESQLVKYKLVKLLLDNDEAGNNATEKLLEAHKNTKDCRYWYSDFKDINAFLLFEKSSNFMREEANHEFDRKK